MTMRVLPECQTRWGCEPLRSPSGCLAVLAHQFLGGSILLGVGLTERFCCAPTSGEQLPSSGKQWSAGPLWQLSDLLKRGVRHQLPRSDISGRDGDSGGEESSERHGAPISSSAAGCGCR